MVDFFEPPRPREPVPDPEWAGPAGHVLPATIPIEQVVARNADVAVYLARISGYPAGFTFDVFVVARDGCSRLDPFSFDHQFEAQRTGEIPPGQLRLGLLFADGTKATNTGDRFDWDGEFGSPPESPVMTGSVRGHGGDGSWRSECWVWPIPPPGPMEFVCEWPAADLPLTRLGLDAQPVIDAASRAQDLFGSLPDGAAPPAPR